MTIMGYFGRWLGIAAIVVFVIASFYFLNAFQAERGRTAQELQPNPSPAPSFMATPKADLTTDWQTLVYTVSVSSRIASRPSRVTTLSIHYPSSMSAKRYDYKTVTLSPVLPAKPFASGDFSVAITTLDPQGRSLQEFVDGLTIPGSSTGIETRTSLIPITIAGLSGLRVVATGVGGNNLGVFLSRGDQIISITASYSGKQNNDYIQMFDLITNSITLN